MDKQIISKIRRRRLQMLVHSCIYYKLNDNLISDAKWSSWAKELAQLQQNYPEESAAVEWYDDFLDWDGSSGAFLPLENEWVMNKALYLLKLCRCKTDKKTVLNKVSKKRKRLF